MDDAPLASPSLQSPDRELHGWKGTIARDSIILEAKLQVPSKSRPRVTCLVLRCQVIKGCLLLGQYYSPMVKSLHTPLGKPQAKAAVLTQQHPLLS